MAGPGVAGSSPSLWRRRVLQSPACMHELHPPRACARLNMSRVSTGCCAPYTAACTEAMNLASSRPNGCMCVWGVVRVCGEEFSAGEACRHAGSGVVARSADAPPHPLITTHPRTREALCRLRRRPQLLLPHPLHRDGVCCCLAPPQHRGQAPKQPSGRARARAALGCARGVGGLWVGGCRGEAQEAGGEGCVWGVVGRQQNTGGKACAHPCRPW